MLQLPWCTHKLDVNYTHWDIIFIPSCGQTLIAMFFLHHLKHIPRQNPIRLKTHNAWHINDLRLENLQVINDFKEVAYWKIHLKICYRFMYWSSNAYSLYLFSFSKYVFCILCILAVYEPFCITFKTLEKNYNWLIKESFVVFFL